MVHIELVQTHYSTMASHKTSCSWHRKSSTNINMTSVWGLRAGRALSKGTGFKCRATSKGVEWKQLICEWDSGQIWRQVVHGKRTFLLPMAAWPPQPTWVQVGKEGKPSVVSNWEPSPVTCIAVACRDSCDSSSCAEVLEMPGHWSKMVLHWILLGLLTDPQSALTKGVLQPKAKLHNKHKGLYQFD